MELVLESIDLLSRMVGEAGCLDLARLTSSTWRRAVPEGAVLVLADMMRIQDCAARRMIDDFGPRRAMAFAIRLRTAVQTAVVAGSAALYVERLRAGLPTRFVPGDIDVWADSPKAADQTCDNLRRLSASSGRVTIRRLNFEEYIDIQARMFQDVPWIEGGGTGETDGTDGTDGFVAQRPSIQIASLKSAPDITVQVIAGTHRTRPGPCACDPAHQGCHQCLSDKTVDGYSVPPWPEGCPHRRFDLDAVACVMRSVDVVERAAGSATGPGIRLLASAVWHANGDPVPPNVLARRLQKYAERGYTEPVVAGTMTISGVERPTPQAVLDVVETVRKENVVSRKRRHD